MHMYIYRIDYMQICHEATDESYTYREVAYTDMYSTISIVVLTETFLKNNSSL